MSNQNQKWSVIGTDSYMRRNPKMPEQWSHLYGAFFKAIEVVWRDTGDRKYFDYIRENIDVMIDENGKIRDYPLNEFKLDTINSGKILFTLYKETGDERYRKAIYSLKEHLRIQPTTEQGLYWHKRIMPYQSVLDGTFMYIPFLAEFEQTFNAPGYYDDLVSQIFTIAADTFDEKTGLYYQGYDDTKEIFWADPVTGRSQNFWGRSIGWFSMMIVDFLDFLPVSHPQRFKIIRLFADLMKALVKVQDESGVWYQVLDQAGREGNYLEASASGMFIYSLAKGIRMGYLDKEFFLAPTLKAYEGELKEFVAVDEEGNLDVKHVCINVDLGATPADDSSYDFYVYAPVGDNDLKGITTFLFASVEVEKLN